MPSSDKFRTQKYTSATTVIENGRSGGSHPFNCSFSSCIYLSKTDFLLRLLTSITNFKFLACVKHVEGKLCFYRIYHIVHSETRQKLFLSARIKLNYHIFAFLWGSGIAGSPTINLHLIFEIFQFEISSLMNWIYFPSLIWIFLPAVACKIQVWNKLKTSLSNLILQTWALQNPSADR